MATNSKENRILACRREAGVFPADQKERHAQIYRGIVAAVEEIIELPDGFALCLPSETEMILTVAEFITLERLCCDFLKFGLEVDPGKGPIRLKLTGGPGVKSFLQSELSQFNGVDKTKAPRS